MEDPHWPPGSEQFMPSVPGMPCRPSWGGNILQALASLDRRLSWSYCFSLQESCLDSPERAKWTGEVRSRTAPRGSARMGEDVGGGDPADPGCSVAAAEQWAVPSHLRPGLEPLSPPSQVRPGCSQSIQVRRGRTRGLLELPPANESLYRGGNGAQGGEEAFPDRPAGYGRASLPNKLLGDPCLRTPPPPAPPSSFSTTAPSLGLTGELVTEGD